VLDLLAAGALSLATVRLLRPHLTEENHLAVLSRPSGRGRQDVLELIAELAPRPDVAPSVRKLPTTLPPPVSASLPMPPLPTAAVVPGPEPAPPILTPPPARRPVVEPTSPGRYRVQFTIGKESHDKLRRLQALLRREIPSGDPGAIFDRAVALLLEKGERN